MTVHRYSTDIVHAICIDELMQLFNWHFFNVQVAICGDALRELRRRQLCS